jgi:putative methionine-R-sulfoxide reductase with GAF domain
MKARDYLQIASNLRCTGDRVSRMHTAVDALWNALKDTGVSWVGFYVHEGGEELVLAARRDRPACSPIGMHGACGQVWRSRKPLVVRDVKELGANYIACDPRDRSEIVIPCLEADGTCWGVLDLDSHDVDSFGEADVGGLIAVLRAAGLTT